jgi:hypothetical protein
VDAKHPPIDPKRFLSLSSIIGSSPGPYGSLSRGTISGIEAIGILACQIFNGASALIEISCRERARKTGFSWKIKVDFFHSIWIKYMDE